MNRPLSLDAIREQIDAEVTQESRDRALAWAKTQEGRESLEADRQSLRASQLPRREGGYAV